MEVSKAIPWDDVVDVVSYLGLKALWAFLAKREAQKPRAGGKSRMRTDVIPVRELRRWPAPKIRKWKGRTVTVEGMFYPGFLLASGWWERSQDAARTTQAPTGGDPIREWLFNGFEQWAPSWECTIKPAPGTDNVLLGQLGCGDEADSILLVIPSDKAGRIREEILGANNLTMTRPVRLVGELWHPTTLLSDTRAMLDKRLPSGWQGAFDRCLLLRSEEKRHTIEPVNWGDAIYSGYLWECLFPKDELILGQPAKLDRAYFLWEHTNFASDQAIRFNIEALESKREILQKHVGKPLVLLQRSAWTIENVRHEAPFYSAQDFKSLVDQILATEATG